MNWPALSLAHRRHSHRSRACPSPTAGSGAPSAPRQSSPGRSSTGTAESSWRLIPCAARRSTNRMVQPPSSFGAKQQELHSPDARVRTIGPCSGIREISSFSVLAISPAGDAAPTRNLRGRRQVGNRLAISGETPCPRVRSRPLPWGQNRDHRIRCPIDPALVPGTWTRLGPPCAVHGSFGRDYMWSELRREVGRR